MADMLVVDPNDEKGLEAQAKELYRKINGYLQHREDHRLSELCGHWASDLRNAFFEAADTRPTTHEVDHRGMLLGVRAAERWVTSWEEVADG